MTATAARMESSSSWDVVGMGGPFLLAVPCGLYRTVPESGFLRKENAFL
jgi:hypothetical protein